VTGPGGKVHAKAATPTNAKRQLRLLRAIEHNPDFKPTGKPAQDSMAKKVMQKY